jgi:hydroxypyruvate isomerase
VLKIAANISMLFRELALLDRFQAAREAGFDGVEMQFPYAESPGDLQRAAKAAGLPVILINAPVSPEHPVGSAGRPELRAVFRAQLAQLCEYAAALEVRFVHVLAGRINSPDDRERCTETLVENLLLGADALAPLGACALIEALNPHDVPSYQVGSLDDAAAILERCRQRVGLQFDFYHVARMGLDPAAELARLLPLVRHVQFADTPGRHEPGTGSLEFEAPLAVLKAAAYEGWLSAEYIPLGHTIAGLGWLDAWRGGAIGGATPRLDS